MSSPEHGELFLACWEHNLAWTPTLLSEYSRVCIKNPFIKAGLKLLITSAVFYGRRLIRKRYDDYDCDIYKMIGESSQNNQKVAVPTPLVG